MDHLILPEGVKPWIVVAYEGKEADYYENQEGQGFLEFPSRLGWDDNEVFSQPKKIESGLYGGIVVEDEKTRLPGEVEKFFQTWLFFGLIIEVFALNSIRVSTEDFLAPLSIKAIQKPQETHVVSTSKLPSLIAEWRKKHLASRDSDKENEDFTKVMAYLDQAGKIIDHHCADGRGHRSIQQYGSVLWPVRDETTTSIIAVASSLRQAARHIYDKPATGEKWPIANSLILYHRIQRKWCKSDAAMIMEDFDIDGQYYIAAADGQTLESLDAHYACTNNSCEAKVADGTYVTRHADTCTEKDDYEPEPRFLGHVSPSYEARSPATLREAIGDIIDASHLPFIRWDFEQRGLATFGHERRQAGTGVPPFIAISHVWANGMGNPFDNSLPYCQLEKIQRLVDDLCVNHLPSKLPAEGAGFWMDTICCMVGNDDASRHYKGESIKSMRVIYREATAVLIIDPWLMSVSSTASVAELCYRVYAAGWSRRLWTHQEGFLGKDVYYQFKDKPLNMDEIDTLARQYQHGLATTGYAMKFPYEASGKTSLYYKGIKQFLDSIEEGHFGADSRWLIYQQLAKSLSYRSTTNIDDEMLCVASVAGLDVGVYSKIEIDKKGNPIRKTKEGQILDSAGNVMLGPDGQPLKKGDKTFPSKDSHRTAEARMGKFIAEIGRFRQGIIFHNYRRLEIPGYRWAPMTLLGHRSSGLGADLDSTESSKIEDYSSLPLNDKYVEIEPFGIRVPLNKYMTKKIDGDSETLSMRLYNKRIDLPTYGLPVDYAGFTIRFNKSQHGLTIDMAERRFAVKYSAPQSIEAIQASASVVRSESFGKPSSPQSPPIQSPTAQSPPETPTFGKKSSFGMGKIGGGLKGLSSMGSASLQTAQQMASMPTSPSAQSVQSLVDAVIPTYEYVVFVAENNVKWEYDRSYVLILQRLLGKNSPREFMAMIGLKSIVLGNRTCVQSLCSAVVRSIQPGDSPKLMAGLDKIDVSDGKTSTKWVVT